LDIELYNNKDVQALLKALDMALGEIDVTLYNFLPTSLDRGSTEYVYVINVLDVDLCLYSFKIMSS